MDINDCKLEIISKFVKWYVEELKLWLKVYITKGRRGVVKNAISSY